jgi:outer membrane protein OmpA-like peptidoglycan-associated protein
MSARISLRRRIACAAAVVCVAGTALAAKPGAAQRNFVSCPIVRDTKTVPCWLAEHDGELYYLGIQTDVSAEFHPPYLGHRVLVEGTLSDAPRICGGLVLDPVRVSPLPELDGTCNTILPAEDRYTVPFAPRPPGPSGGRLAFDPPPGGAPPKPARTGPQNFTIEYGFDALITGPDARVLTDIFNYATKTNARRISIVGYRGASLLSDGSVMTEPESLPEERAREVASLLARAGLDPRRIKVDWSRALATSDGVSDWHARRVVVRVEP